MGAGAGMPERGGTGVLVDWPPPSAALRFRHDCCAGAKDADGGGKRPGAGSAVPGFACGGGGGASVNAFPLPPQKIRSRLVLFLRGLGDPTRLVSCFEDPTRLVIAGTPLLVVGPPRLVTPPPRCVIEPSFNVFTIGAALAASFTFSLTSPTFSDRSAILLTREANAP